MLPPLPDVGRLTRAASRILLTAWAVVPPVALLIATGLGRLTIAEAVDVTQWMVVPWALVLAILVLGHAVLGPGRGRRRS